MEVVGGPSSSLVPVGGGPGLQHGRAVLGGLLGRHLQQLPVQDEAEHVVTSDVRGIVSFLLLYIKALLETFLVLGAGAMEVEGVRDDGSRGGGVLQDLHHDHPHGSGRVLNETQPSSTLSSSGNGNLHFICFQIFILFMFLDGSMPGLLSHDSLLSPTRGEPRKTPPRGDRLPSSSGGGGSPSPIGLENSWPVGGLLREYQAAWDLLMRAPPSARALVMGGAAPPVSSTPQDSSAPPESTGLTLSTDGKFFVLGF